MKIIDEIQKELDERGIGNPRLISGVHIRLGNGRGDQEVFNSGIFLRNVGDDYVEAIIYSSNDVEHKKLEKNLFDIVHELDYLIKPTPGRYEIRENRSMKLKDLLGELGFRGFGPSATYQGTERGQGSKYPKADENSQPEVVKAVKRFRTLPESERNQIPLLYWLLGDDISVFKMTKVDGKYQNERNESQRCSGCKFLYKEMAKNNRYTCSQISGEINPNGWCKLFVDKRR